MLAPHRIPLLALIAACWVPAALGQQAPASPTIPAKPAADYRVVYWFDAKGSLRHHAYDLRKGEYTKAVADWVSAVRYDAYGYAVPGPMATVRDVRLGEEPGANEADKLASAIDRQARAITGFDVTKLQLTAGPPLLLQIPERRRVAARPVLPSLLSTERYADPSRLAPAPAPFPFPVPFPRPHP